MSKSKYFIVILLVFSLNQFIYSMNSGTTDIFSSYLNGTITDENLKNLVETVPWQLLKIDYNNIFDLSKSDIERSARPLLNKYHPDKNKSNPNRDKIEELYKHINNAKDVLIKNAEFRKNCAFNIIGINFLWDVLNSIKEINKISILGSVDSKSIFKAAKIDSLINAYAPIFSLIKFQNIVLQENIFPAQSNIIKVARTLSLLSNLASFKFLNKDFEIIKNSYCISKNNKYLNKDFKKEKFTQYVWLAVNKLFPYATFIVSSMFNENRTLTRKSFSLFEVSKAISHISEILRKNRRYEIELGNCKAYKANKDMKKMFLELK